MATGVAMGAGKKAALAAMGMFSGVGVVTAYKLDQSVKADLTLHPPHLHWSHSGMIDSLDHASVRRGYQVNENKIALPNFLTFHHCEGVQASVRCLPLPEVHGLQEPGGSLPY